MNMRQIFELVKLVKSDPKRPEALVGQEPGQLSLHGVGFSIAE
jgi:hypothetical protein